MHSDKVGARDARTTSHRDRPHGLTGWIQMPYKVQTGIEGIRGAFEDSLGVRADNYPGRSRRRADRCARQLLGGSRRAGGA